MKKIAPTKAEIALLEPFSGLTLERIHVPTNSEEFASAAAEIKAAGIVGFDTESKPTFVTGDVSEGPHVVQFALHDRADNTANVCAEFLRFVDQWPPMGDHAYEKNSTYVRTIVTDDNPSLRTRWQQFRKKDAT